MENKIDSFRIAINDYLSSVTRENYNDKCEKFIEIVKQYNSDGLAVGTIIELLTEFIHQNDAEGWNAEVAIEIVERIGGHCIPSAIIKLI